jgi:hypothetical protein
VQLLARNLGIPNVTVDESLIPELTVYEGQSVILAASPGGSVQLILDKGQLNHIFMQKNSVRQSDSSGSTKTGPQDP